jgi:hypothetical protein
MAMLQPTALFMGGLKREERNVVSELLDKAKNHGFSRVIEPCSGMLVISKIAKGKGYSHIEASDIGLIPCLIGNYITGKNIESLNLVSDLALDCTSYAKALYSTVLSRNIKNLNSAYYSSVILRSIQENKESCIKQIQEKLDNMKEFFGSSINFFNMDVFDHLDKIADDQNAIAILWPPITAGDYESFYNVGISWNEPKYNNWNPDNDIKRIMEKYKDARALIIAGEMRESIADCSGIPFYYRPGYRQGNDVMMVSNQPEKIEQILGKKVYWLKSKVFQLKGTKGILPYDYEVQKDSIIEVKQVNEGIMRYYASVLANKFVGYGGGSYYVFIIDGYVAGVFGLMLPMGLSLNANDSDEKSVWISLAFSAKNKNWRIIRLNTYLSCIKSLSYKLLAGTLKSEVKSISTTMFTNQPISMCHRGIMKMVARYDCKEKEKAKYRLVYRKELDDRTLEEVYAEWYEKEIIYREKKDGKDS